MDKTFYEALIPSLKARSVIKRFLKVFIAGAFTSMGLMTVVVPKSWQEMSTILTMLSIAGLYGGVSGVILGFEKWWNWID
jgi:hypothetical protein